MPGTSTQLASKARIVADLQASVALSGVLIVWGLPNWDPNKHHDRIAVTDIDNTLMWSTIGTRQRQENYVIKVEIDVHRNGTGAQVAETRADALMTAVDAALIADYTLGSTVSWAYVDHTSLSTVQDGTSGYLSHGETHIAVTNRI